MRSRLSGKTGSGPVSEAGRQVIIERQFEGSAVRVSYS